MKKKVKKHYETLFRLPPDDSDFEAFGLLILNEFIETLKSKSQAIVCNRVINSVIFTKELDSIKEEFLNEGIIEDNTGD